MRIAVIRLKGSFSIGPDIKKTLTSFKLDRLYSCTLVVDNESTRGMLQTVKDFVAYGPVENDTISLLLLKRGKKGGKKLSQAEADKLAIEISSSGKKLSDHGVSPVFFLSPPQGGFGSRKTHVPFGPVGKNPQIAELISRMA